MPSTKRIASLGVVILALAFSAPNTYLSAQVTGDPAGQPAGQQDDNGFDWGLLGLLGLAGLLGMRRGDTRDAGVRRP